MLSFLVGALYEIYIYVRVRGIVTREFDEDPNRID